MPTYNATHRRRVKPRSLGGLLVLVLLTSMVFVIAITDRADADTKVTSFPGLISVIGGNENNRWLIQDSLLRLNPPPVYLVGYVAGSPFFKALLADLEEAERQIPPPYGRAFKLTAAGIAAAFALATFLSVRQNVEKLSIQRWLLIHDFSGTAITYGFPCELIPPNRMLEPPPPGSTTVGCPIETYKRPESDEFPPILNADSGGGNDGMKLNLSAQCRYPTRCLWRPNLSGGDGDDDLQGSEDGDLIEGGLGNDVILGAGGHDLIFGAFEGKLFEEFQNQWRRDVDQDRDFLSGDAGSDMVQGQWDMDIVSGGPDPDIGASYFWIPRDDPYGPLTIWNEQGTLARPLDGGHGVDTVIGGGDFDSMRGGTEADTILAREGDFGDDEERDLEADCAGDHLTVLPNEYYRATPFGAVYPGSKADPIENCLRPLSSPVSQKEITDAYNKLRKIGPTPRGEVWPWMAKQ